MKFKVGDVVVLNDEEDSECGWEYHIAKILGHHPDINRSYAYQVRAFDLNGVFRNTDIYDIDYIDDYCCLTADPNDILKEIL